MALCTTARVLGLLAPLALAERLNLQGVQVPDSLSLQALHAFYVNTEGLVPFLSGEPARVEFRGLGLESNEEQTKAVEMLAGKGSVQVSLIPYTDFWQVIDPKHFCCNARDVASGRCTADRRLLLHLSRDAESQDEEEARVTRAQVDEFLAEQLLHNHSRMDASENSMARVASVVTEAAEASAIFSHTVLRLAPASSREGLIMTERHVMHRSGVYMFVVSNCGRSHVPGATLVGEVAVKSPFGFLPGNVWPMLPLAMLLVNAYALMGIVWCMRLLLWRGGALFEIQRLLSCVLGISCGAAFVQFAFYWTWNAGGTYNLYAHVLSSALVALTKLSTWLLLLVASLGWGLTRQQLGQPLRVRLLAFSTLYLVTHVNTLERADGTSRWTVAWLFGQIMDMGFVCSIFRALCYVMRTLREQQLLDRLLMFQRLRCVLVLCLLVALVAVCVEVVLLVWVRAVEWKWGWIGPAVGQLLTLAIHLCMVYLWAPNKYSQSDSQRAVALLPVEGQVEAQADAAAGPQLDLGERLQWHEMTEPAPRVQQEEPTTSEARQQCQPAQGRSNA